MSKKEYIRIPAEKVWQAQKPHYNGYACGHGPHGDKSYNRNKEKRRWKKGLASEF